MSTTRLEPNFPGTIGRTIPESVPAWRMAATGHRSGAPNILIVVLDDTGWSDLGAFGSEIATPTFDGLADRGVRYSNFHVTPLCSPTRAALLTGRNHHSVGMRFLADTDTGFPNSRGYVHRDIPMLPSVLQTAGYGTYLVGKWHLAPLHEVTPAGPYQNWPLARGFDRYYGFLDGCTDQYSPELYEDNHQVTTARGDGYHLTEDLADRAIRYVTEHVAYRDPSPFYLQLALGATHAPFQVPPQYIDRYVDVFAKGWDRTRTERLRRQIAAGVMPDYSQLTDREDDVAAWDSLDSDHQFLYTRLQAAFAGFLEHADEQVGRVLSALSSLGVLDDTVVLVMSDNGASREGGDHGAVDCNGPYSGKSESVAEQFTKLDLIGGPNGPAHYPQGWAMAGNTPFRKYKQYTDLGGVRSPMIISWPNGIEARGLVRHDFVHVIDVMPTLLELAGVDGPEMDGASFAPTEKGSQPVRRSCQYWEMLGHRAIWHQGWKAVTAHVPGTSFDDDDWRLYDTSVDPSESTDVAEENPDVLALLKQRWWEEAEANQVFPLDDRTLVELLALRSPKGLFARRRVVLPQGSGHIPFASGLTGSERSMRLTAMLLDCTIEDEGVLFSSGNSQGGYVLYLLDGRLCFEHRALGQTAVLTAPVSVPPSQVGVQWQRFADRTAHADLLIDDTVVASGVIPLTSAHPSFWGADIGADVDTQVSTAYKGEFPFPPEVLHSVVIEFYDAPPIAEIAEALLHIE